MTSVNQGDIEAFRNGAGAPDQVTTCALTGCCNLLRPPHLMRHQGRRPKFCSPKCQKMDKRARYRSADAARATKNKAKARVRERIRRILMLIERGEMLTTCKLPQCSNLLNVMPRYGVPSPFCHENHRKMHAYYYEGIKERLALARTKVSDRTVVKEAQVGDFARRNAAQPCFCDNGDYLAVAIDEPCPCIPAREFVDQGDIDTELAESALELDWDEVFSEPC